VGVGEEWRWPTDVNILLSVANISGAGPATAAAAHSDVNAASDKAQEPPKRTEAAALSLSVGYSLPVTFCGLGGDGVASRALPAGTIHRRRPEGESDAWRADQGHPAAKLAKNRRL